MTMHLRKILIAAALFGLAASAHAEVLGKCGCQAARNVKNRLCETRAAQREFDRLGQEFMAQESKKKAPVLLDGTIKGNIVECVKEALNTSDDVNAQDATAETDGNCNVTAPQPVKGHLPPSGCINESVAKHEQYHRQVCLQRENGKWERYWSENAPWRSLMDTKFAMSVVDYLAEEAAAYMQEEADLTDTLKHLMTTCKPEDKIADVEDDDEVPGKKAGDKYRFDLSLEGCPTRPRKSPSACPYPP